MAPTIGVSPDREPATAATADDRRILRAAEDLLRRGGDSALLGVACRGREGVLRLGGRIFSDYLRVDSTGM